MILNYERPQSTIANNLAITAAGLASRFRAVCVGPNYRLNRFGQDVIPDGKSFLAAGQSLAYSYSDGGIETALPSTDIVDLASVAVYGQGLEALLASYTNSTTDKFYLNSVSTPHILRCSVPVRGSGLSAALTGRPVALGDIAYVSDGVSGQKRRTVVGLQGAAVASHYGANVGNNDSNAGNSAYNPGASSALNTAGVHPAGKTLSFSGTFNALVLGSKVADKYGEDFTITVTTGGTAASGLARVSISSASGLWGATGVAPTNSSGDYVISDAALAGLTATIDAGSPGTLVAGEVFTFRAVGAYTRLTSTQLGVGDTGSGFTGTRDTSYLVTVTQGATGGFTGAKVSIVDTVGLDTPQTNVSVTAGTYFPVGSFGLQMKFIEASMPAQDGLRAGDVYFINAVAATQSTTVFDKVVFDGPVVNTGLFSDTSTALASIGFYLGYSGAIAANAAAGGTAWAASGSVITVNSGLALLVPERTSGSQWCAFANGVGTLSPSFRSLIPRPPTSDPIYAETDAQIQAALGPIDMDNDLAFGASEMLGGAQGRGIYIVPVATNNLAGFNDALGILESSDIYYALAILTDDLDIMLGAKTHVLAMCQKDVKNFRKAYVGTDSPGVYPVLGLKVDGITNYLAIISDHGGVNTLVSTDEDVDFRTLGLAPGDQVRFGAASYPLASVIAAKELLLSSGPTNPVSPAAPFQLWKADTVASQKAFINQRAAALGTELVSHIWQENGTRYVNGLPTVIPNKYVACHIAGLRSAMAAQQGLTRTEVTTVTAIPNMYLRYRKADLDDIAAHGTYIITQESANGPVFVRHQLTTQTGKGSLYYEDTATVIMHSVNFATKDIVDPKIGKKNATPDTVSEIDGDLTDMLREKSRTLVKDIGPEIIGFRNLVVRLHPILKDRIQVSGIITIPLPLNNIDVVWDGEVFTPVTV